MSSWTKLRAGGKYRRVARHFDCLATARSPRLASPTVRIRCPEAAGDGRAYCYRRCRGCGAGRRMDKRGKIKITAGLLPEASCSRSLRSCDPRPSAQVAAPGDIIIPTF